MDEVSPSWKKAIPLLDESLAQLGESDRQLVILHYLQRKPFRVIAESVGRSESAVQRQCHRCLDKLARILRSKGVIITSGSLVGLLAQEGVKHIYIDGGNTLQRFLAAGLVDEMTITLIPVLLGDGIPLFGPLENDIRLTHISTQSWEFGLVQLKYEVTK